MLSRHFIERPIFATVVAAFILIAGIVAIKHAPDSQWPNIQPREIQLNAFYPGANAATLADSVAAPLEQQLGGIAGLLYTHSTSSGNGQLSLVATFDANSNLDVALLEVNARVQKAMSSLPEEVRRQGLNVQKRASNSLLIITLFSRQGQMSLEDMSNYARLNVLDELNRLPGVAGVGVSTSRHYSMRIWLRPDKLTSYGLTAVDVLNAVREQNSQYTAGRIGEEPLDHPVDFTFTVNVPGRLSQPKEFEDLIVRTTSTGAIVRLKDVARVELGANRYDVETKRNHALALPMVVSAQSDVDSLATARLVRQRMHELSTSFPATLAYEVSYDSTIHVRQAINEVVITLIEALILVFFVVLVFLGSARATIIPMLAVPVSIVGAFAVIYKMGFSINTITLFGMVFAVGIVVDDAVIVVENVKRLAALATLSIREATTKSMSEVTRALVAIVLVVAAVFMPLAFVHGASGMIYRQFAVTIIGSVAISGFVALTLTPALCAKYLTTTNEVTPPWSMTFQRGFDAITRLYLRIVTYSIDHRAVSLAVLMISISVVGALAYLIPTSFFPREDRSIIYVVATLPDGASLSRSQAVIEELTTALQKHPAVEEVISFAGIDGSSGANLPGGVNIWVPLKDWNARRAEGMAPANVVEYIENYGSDHIKDARIAAFEPAPITGGSTTGGFEAYIEARGSTDPHRLVNVVQMFIDGAKKRSELTAAGSTYRSDVPQIGIRVDAEKAKALGVGIDDLYTTLHTNFSAYYINDFTYAGRTWEVQMQADAPYRAHVTDLRNVFVRSATTGQQIPLTTLVHAEDTTGPESVERFNGFPAARLFARVASGFSSESAYRAMEAVARETLPSGYVLSWSGSAYQEHVIGQSANMSFLIGVLIVFLVLAALYEHVVLPFAVIISVPIALIGAFIAIWLRGLPNDVFFQIGLATIIALCTKNGILIAEFAQQRQHQGFDLKAAAIEAARLRFRPIVMTSAAFIMGVLPLMLATGPGANARHSIGTGVIGGMLTATFVAPLFVPTFYVWCANVIRTRQSPPSAQTATRNYALAGRDAERPLK